MEVNEHSGKFVVDMPIVLDLPAAADLRDLLIDVVAQNSAADVILDCGDIDRISTAAIQVILAAAAALRLVARRLVLEQVGAVPTMAFGTLGLAAELEQLVDT